MENPLLRLPLARTGHRVPKALEPVDVLGPLEPGEVVFVGVKGEIERRLVLNRADSPLLRSRSRWSISWSTLRIDNKAARASIREEPLRQVRHELKCIVSPSGLT